MALPIFPLCLVVAITILTQGCAAYEKSLEGATKVVNKVAAKSSETLEAYDISQRKVTEEEEIEIGGALISGLLGAAPLVDDAKLQRYVNDVGFWVASQSSRKSLTWRFGVIQSDGVNAFAAPGGYIVITMGLFNLLENEAQLAGVLAHEIGHVVYKHHLIALQKSMTQDFWINTTTDVLGDTATRNKLKEWAKAGMQVYTTGLDRDFEYDADLYGVVLAARAGYDAFALLEVLATIDSINPESGELLVLLKTHPPTADRLNRLSIRMDSKNDTLSLGVSNAERFQQIADRK